MTNVVSACLLLITTVCAGEPRIDAEFPGGNLVVERIAGDDVWVHQDLRDTPKFWFWWNCRVQEAAGRTLTFHFTQGNVFGPLGPAVSRDGGQTWDWLGSAACDGDNFVCSFGQNETDTRLAFAIPYTAANLDAWQAAHNDNPHVVRESLTRSNGGRDVPLLRVGCVNGSAKKRVLITCRHHACESLASFVVEGAMTRFLAADEDAAWLRSNVELVVAPIMDTDGVEQGDQGKLRPPHDHWLDYGDDSRYAEVRALKQRWIDHPLPVDIALDVHCPSIRDRFIYFATGPDPGIGQSTTRLSAALEAVQSGPLRYAPGHDQPFGKGWNRPDTYADVRSFMHWADGLPGVQAVGTLEFPYAAVGEETVTADRARQFGSDLADAFARFLSDR